MNSFFTTPLYINFRKQCLKAIQTSEPAIFIFAPKTDRDWRIRHFIYDNPSLETVVINLTQDKIEGLNSFEKILIHEVPTSKNEILIFITNIEVIFFERRYSIINSIVNLQINYPNYRFILATEVDLTSPEIAKHLHISLFSNICYYPLYDISDGYIFISYLEEKFKLKLPKKITNQIVNMCVHPWLIKQCMRALKHSPHLTLLEIFSSDEITFRLQQISLSFLKSEKNVLYKLLKNEKIHDIDELHAYDFLNRMSIIKDGKITLPLLAKYLVEHMPKVTIEVINSQILFNNINVEHHFSKNEKSVFRTLFKTKDQIVSRDIIAKSIWPLDTQYNYSDWAIDRSVARLRKKLIELGLPKNVIKTVRNVGYKLSTS